jgi:hypothetical protein
LFSILFGKHLLLQNSFLFAVKYLPQNVDFWWNALQVSGQLDDRLQSWDALRAALPVGTVSGAPKVKCQF